MCNVVGVGYVKVTCSSELHPYITSVYVLLSTLIHIISHFLDSGLIQYPGGVSYCR